jgi:hypothetical protein
MDAKEQRLAIEAKSKLKKHWITAFSGMTVVNWIPIQDRYDD